MVQPSKKLLLAAIVMGVGLCMAWPFRKSQPTAAWEKSNQQAPHTDTPTGSSQSTQNAPSSTAPGIVLMANKAHQGAPPPGGLPLMAQSDSTSAGTPSRAGPKGSSLHAGQVHQATAPTIAPARPIGSSTRTNKQQQQQANQPLSENLRSHPVYAGAGRDLSPEGDLSGAWPGESIHEIRDGDTLDKLAKRYLGDSGRALEIFELNRDKLKNPHLPLRIGEELRIPMTGRRSID
jgi:LysM domain-containing protein